MSPPKGVPEPELAVPGHDELRRFVIVFLLAGLLSGSALAALNVSVDARAEFGTGMLPPIIYQADQIKVDHLAERTRPIETVVLGSSRVMKIAPVDLESAGHGPSFNFGFPSASPAIQRTILEGLAERGHRPDRIMYGVELDQFQPGRASGIPEDDGLRQFGWNGTTTVSYGVRLWDSLSAPYVADTMRSLRYATTGYPPGQSAIDPDGYLHYLAWDAAMASGTWDGEQRARDALGGELVRYGELVPPTQPHLDDLDAFLRTAAAQGSDVDLFITPLHEALLEPVMNGTAYATAFRAFHDALAARCGVHAGLRVHDLHDAKAVGLDLAGWYDAQHYTRENGRVLVEAIDSRAFDLCQRDADA